MRVDLLTKEYPPFIYGGAGVHVNELAKVLRPLADVRVHAFGGPREPGTEGADDGVTGYPRSLSSTAPTPPCAPSASTWRWPRAPREPTSSTPTPGTPTSPATWPGCFTASPTSSAPTP